MPPLTLYYFDASPPSRSVMLTIKYLNLDVAMKTIDFFNDEQLQPYYRQINPAHTMPTLDDNGTRIWESRTIIRYLVNIYGKDDTLYPKDPKKRVHVDMMLDFDLGTLYRAIEIYFEVYMFEERAPSEKELGKVQEKLSILDVILQNSSYIAGPELTIADISAIVTVTTMEVFIFDVKNNYPNVYRWANKVRKELPHYDEVNELGLAQFREYFNIKKKALKDLGIL